MKKALSDLITIVLLIGIVLVVFIGLFTFGSDLFTSTTEEASRTKEKSVTCFSDVKIEIIDACYNTQNIFITLENKKDSIIDGNFFIISLQGDNTVVVPTPPFTNLNPFERKKIVVTYPSEVGVLTKISIIPRIMTSSGPIFCTNNVAESDEIKNC